MGSGTQYHQDLSVWIKILTFCRVEDVAYLREDGVGGLVSLNAVVQASLPEQIQGFRILDSHSSTAAGSGSGSGI
jgi:hypothetical protein